MRPEQHSYDALVYTTVAWQGFLVATVVIMALYTLARSLAGLLDPAWQATFDCTMLLWHYMVGRGWWASPCSTCSRWRWAMAEDVPVSGRIARPGLPGLVLGQGIWAAHFLFSYVFVALACARGFADMEVLGISIVPLVLTPVTVLALAAIAGLGFIDYRHWRAAPDGTTDAHALPRPFLGFTGLLTCGLPFVATIYVALPINLVPPCARF